MNWLTETTIILTPLSLVVIILAGLAAGWSIYSLRGHRHWAKKLQRYHLPVRAGSQKARKVTQPNYGYLEYVPEVVNNPPKIKKPLAIKRPAKIIHKNPAPVAAPIMQRPIAQAPVPPIQPIPDTEPPLEPVYSTKDDLQVIEGIGPKIEELLNSNGIHTWRELAQTPENNLLAILNRVGKRFAMHKAGTWPKQAHMAHTAQWEKLKEYQDFLHSGQE